MRWIENHSNEFKIGRIYEIVLVPTMEGNTDAGLELEKKNRTIFIGSNCEHWEIGPESRQQGDASVNRRRVLAEFFGGQGC
jgi:hypothetical protein